MAPPAASPRSDLPSRAGIGLRAPHIADLSRGSPKTGWLELHAENYMNFGPASAALERLRTHYPVAVHGVGLSLGSALGVDDDHLARLKSVCDRFEPAVVSEHMAWSVSEGIYLNDLLPVPYDEEALAILCRNIERVQETIGRTILIENLSAYVGFTRSTMIETEFLAEIVKRTGCGLLLDINNVYVSAHNMGFDAVAFIEALPGQAIGEIHLAGHATNETPDGPVLVDDHGSCIAAPVWSLYRRAIERFGPRPTLIEWDTAVPPLEVLLDEAAAADRLAQAVAEESLRAHNGSPPDAPSYMPRSRVSSVEVSVCDHHPLARAQAKKPAHA